MLLDSSEEVRCWELVGQKLNGVSKPAGEELSIRSFDLNSAREKSGRWLDPIVFDHCLMRLSGAGFQAETGSYLNTAVQTKKISKPAGDEFRRASVLYFDGCVVVIEKKPMSEAYQLGTFQARNTVFILENEAVFVRKCQIDDHRYYADGQVGIASGLTTLRDWLQSSRGFADIQPVPELNLILAIAGLHKSAGALALWRGWYETWRGIETNMNQPTTAETAMISVVAQQQTVFKSIVPDYPFKLPYAVGA